MNAISEALSFDHEDPLLDTAITFWRDRGAIVAPRVAV